MRRHPWLTAAIVLFVLCVVTFFAFEWRAEKRWQRYAADARARGVKLLLAEFERPPIPEEVNFARLPMLQKASANQTEDKSFDLPREKWPSAAAKAAFRTSDVNVVPKFGDPIKVQPINWQEWQQYFFDAGYLTKKTDDPVGDVLRALEHYAPELQQWSEWHTRTQSQFPFDSAHGVDAVLPHVSVFQGAAKIFALRLRAHLALHDSASAYADFQDGLQAYRALRTEPRLIPSLVRIAVMHVLIAAVGDGCKDHAWSEEDCRKIEADLAGIRVWDDWQLALASERASFNTTVETWLGLSMRERGKMLASWSNLGMAQPSTTQTWMASLYPRGMIRDNQRLQNQYFDELLARIDTAQQSIHLDLATPSEMATVSDGFEEFHYFLVLISQSAYKRVEWRYITLQTALDETRLACALERFRVQRGAYPAALSELAPDFIAAIPNDIYAGVPYRYRRIGETTFRLYGVGSNRTDDGGSLAPGVPESKQLDAIWLYAPPAEPGRK